MHWFWRATIVSFIATVFGGVCFYGFNWGMYGLVYLIGGSSSAAAATENLAVQWLVFLLPFTATTLIALAVRAVLTKAYPAPADHETRCRKCGYILRGITEPRCSECGERI
jgi:zinc transporter ZupT